MYPNKPLKEGPNSCVRLVSDECPIETFDFYSGACNSGAIYCKNMEKL